MILPSASATPIFTFDAAACDAIITKHKMEERLGTGFQEWLDTVKTPDDIVGDEQNETKYGFALLDFWRDRCHAAGVSAY